MRAALLIRGALFTVLVPGIVAGWLPVALADGAPAGGLWQGGWVLVAVGGVAYLGCLKRFLSLGGTPSIYFARPLRFLMGEEPDRLATRGLYHRSRNPMYLAVLTVIAGMAVVFASKLVTGYLVAMIVVFNVVVRRIEEPHLRAARGAEYDEYCQRVPRWL